jgi:hypothetical protein
MKRRDFFLCPCVIFLCAGAQGNVQAGELRVGAARVSVTPPTEAFPYLPSETPSLNLAPSERRFSGVHDEIYARALILDDGRRRAALIVLEVTAVPNAEALAKRVARQLGIPEAYVMLAATHTHSVPLFSYSGANPSAREAREIERLKDGALAAARQASSVLQPARVVFGRGEAWVNVNNGEQIGSVAGYDPNGPSDKTLDVVRFETRAGAPIALLVNYASHAEVMFRSVTLDQGYEVSGDLPGAVSRILESAPGAAPIVVFSAGAEADQLSLFKSLQPRGRLPGADEGAAGWSVLDVQARRLADSVLAVTATLPTGVSEANIHAAKGAAICPGQQLRIDPHTGAVSSEAKPPVNIPLSVIQVNDIALAGVGGDVATAIGQQFKAVSPITHSILISMAGTSIGYVFPDASYVHPGHGLTKSPLAPHCAEQAIANGLVKLLKLEPARH